jgi:hypothetical protein
MKNRASEHAPTAGSRSAADRAPAQRVAAPNQIGLPDALKSGIEALSGQSLDQVRLRRNSSKPAQLNAPARAQSSEIHLAPGQQKHLPREAWRVVQQAQGRVRPTGQLKASVPINDDPVLETEADVTGAKALQTSAATAGHKDLSRAGRPLPPRAAKSSRPRPGADAAPATPPRSVVQRQVRVGDIEYLSAASLPGFDQLAAEAQQRAIQLVRDRTLHIFKTDEEFREAAYGRTLRDHPLAGDKQVVEADVLHRMRQINPHATVMDLLSDTPEAKQVWREYRASRRTGKADELMLKSILGAHELHRTGSAAKVLGQSPRVMDDAAAARAFDHFNAPYNKRNQAKLVAQYHLDPAETKALKAYTSPNKADRKSEYYMWGDRSADDWKPFRTGWEALDSALAKIPSLGQLGLQITTYRVPRPPSSVRGTDEMEAYSHMRAGTNVRHGHDPMPGGQFHYMSTALTYNVHSRGILDRGAVAITGHSGRYINPFGVMSGSVDGGEVLYPHHVVTAYEGVNPTGVVTATHTHPVHHFREIDSPHAGEDVVEDNRFQQTRQGGLEESHRLILDALERLPEDLAEYLHAARIKSGVAGDMMYLRTADLLRLTDAFRQAVLVMLDGRPERVERAREQTGTVGEIMDLPLDRFVTLASAALH